MMKGKHKQFEKGSIGDGSKIAFNLKIALKKSLHPLPHQVIAPLSEIERKMVLFTTTRKKVKEEKRSEEDDRHYY
mgnify:CR=1 FL=1